MKRHLISISPDVIKAKMASTINDKTDILATVKSSFDATDKSDPQWAVIGLLLTLVEQLQKQNQQQQLLIEQLSAKIDNKNLHNEVEEKERKRSFVIAGLDEAPDNLSAREQFKNDREVVGKVLDELNVGSDALAVYRMGRPDKTKKRLIKVVMPTSFFQTAALRNAKLLKQSVSFSKLFIRPSLTKEQREADFLLRQECRRKNAENSGGKKFRVVRGQIIEIMGN